MRARPDGKRWSVPKQEDAEMAIALSEETALEAGSQVDEDKDQQNDGRRVKAKGNEETPPTKGPEDSQLWDLGGNGCCGLMCLAAFQARSNGKV